MSSLDASLVLLNGETNDVNGVLSDTAKSRAKRAKRVWAELSAQYVDIPVHICAGSGIGDHFNRTGTMQYEYLRRELEEQGLPPEAWLSGWPSCHTVHDGLMTLPVVEDYLFSLGPGQTICTAMILPNLNA